MDELKRLQNGIITLFSDNITCINSWGFYLFNVKFNDEPELRNKIGIIWLASLFDSLDAETKVLGHYKELAERLNQRSLRKLCDKAGEFFETVKEVVRLYNKQEQLFIINMRNQWVHSWLAQRHKTKFTIKYFDGSTFKREEITGEEYHKLIYDLFDHPQGLDGRLVILRQRFTDSKLRYWHAVALLQAQMQNIISAVYSGQEFDIA